ncbi:protein kinase domain-containing protein [Gorillibacterium sp. sgz5001074]|uniref:protein kinase domain-containing protein n=1 Tax=Gorillibacterium sp. sgz5001074 TaxID=3446695 RepID=UPI003F665E7D
MNTSSNPPLYVGMRVQGKWNGGEYRIEKGLGEGANGKVYLVSRGEALVAMKVGTDAMDLQAEANVLKVLSKMEGSFRRFLLDVDDFHMEGKDYPFYIMKYVRGRQLQEYMGAKGKDWFPVVGLRLLEKLAELHAKGYVFGDLKRENVLVSEFGHVELVDFGGVTPMGKAVKQFTELYDRGYWNAGIRSADGAYDVFAFAVLCVHVCGGPKTSFNKAILPQVRNLDELLAEIRSDPQLKEYAPFLLRALKGEIPSAGQALAEWRGLLKNRTGHTPAGMGQLPTLWVKAGFAASVMLFAAVLWYYW